VTANVLIRGGGDLASGVTARLHRAGLQVLITELPNPLVVRRLVAFAEAVYSGETMVGGITAQLAENFVKAEEILGEEKIAVLGDPDIEILADFKPIVLVDGRMRKEPPEVGMEAAPLVIGLGPGFVAGENCHAVVETMRGHNLGRVIWEGSAQADTGIPDAMGKIRAERVLRAPADGRLAAHAAICDHVEIGDLIAVVSEQAVVAPFMGVLRGLVHEGVEVKKGMKIGDVDPRDDRRYCTTISDKSLAVGGGVMEAVLSRADNRERLA
jgi:xanthine dehydrogenase accessory factor